MHMVAASQLMPRSLQTLASNLVSVRVLLMNAGSTSSTHTRRMTLQGMRAKNGHIQLVTRATEGRVTKGSAHLRVPVCVE
jgi:hypothetical protein